MEDGILSLKWNNHYSTFIQALSSLHKGDLYSDVTLACEGKYFHVHKLILSVCSEYFQEILAQTKCQHPVIILKDVGYCDLEALLNYMYAGEANVAQKDLSRLIKSAECLRIKGLAVPDESTLPTKERKRFVERDQTYLFSKRRRNEEGQASHRIGRDMESDSDSRLSDVSTARSIQNSSERSRQRVESNLNDEDHVQQIPEILLDDHSLEVKEELHEPKVEEPDDQHHQLGNASVELGYTQINLNDASNSERLHNQDSQSSHGLTDLISHAVASTSGFQGHESISETWEPNSSSVSISYNDSFSQEDNQNHPIDVAVVGKVGDISTQPRGGFHQLSSNSLQAVLDCPYCPRAFLYRSDLTRHLRSHTGEKPFNCPFCTYRGTQKTHLHEHIKRKHRYLIPQEQPDQNNSSDTQPPTVELIDST